MVLCKIEYQQGKDEILDKELIHHCWGGHIISNKPLTYHCFKWPRESRLQLNLWREGKLPYTVDSFQHIILSNPNPSFHGMPSLLGYKPSNIPS